MHLNEAGVPCTLEIVEGAFHAFDLVAPKTRVVGDFRESYLAALGAHLWPEHSHDRKTETQHPAGEFARADREYASLPM